VAGILSAAVIAAGVILAGRTTPQPQEYASPGNPCALVSQATVAKYLPSASITGPVPGVSGAGGPQVGGCAWNAPTGSLVVDVSVYGSLAGPADAQQGFDSYVQANSRGASFGSGEGVSVTGERSVTGLGDQARVIFQTLTPAPSYLVDLHIRAGNAEIDVDLERYSKPAGAAQLAKTIAIARTVLASLASPADTSSPSQEPLYATYVDPCRLVTTATVATYLPGATVNPQTPSAQQGFNTCSWSTPDASRSLAVDVSIYGFVTGPNGAQQAFDSAVKSNHGPAASGQQSVTGLGDRAAATLEFKGFSHIVLLDVWSSNAEIEITYTSYWYSSSPSVPTRAAQLAASIAMARDILAALPRA